MFIFILFLFGCSKNVDKVTTKTNVNTTSIKKTDRITKSTDIVHPDVFFVIVFKNYDDSILCVSKTKSGDYPLYDLSDPVRADEGKKTYKFCGWNPTIEPASEDMTYIAQYEIIEKTYYIDGNYVYFGLYPQSQEIDNDIITSLNELVGTPLSQNDEYIWNDYGYYANGSIASYMWYIDVDNNNDGINDYRGVYLSSYRAISYERSNNESIQKIRNYKLNNIYWFRYEIIKWNIIKTQDGKAMIISNIILDSQDFYPSNTQNTFTHNGGTGYVNDYNLSNIRVWLNSSFYNTAFNELEKGTICEEEEIGYKKYDKVFLISWEESTLLSREKTNEISGTSYALMQGLSEYGEYSNWWTRSAHSASKDSVYIFPCRDYYVGDVSYHDLARQTINGVRPCVWIEL